MTTNLVVKLWEKQRSPLNHKLSGQASRRKEGDAGNGVKRRGLLRLKIEQKVGSEPSQSPDTSGGEK